MLCAQNERAVQVGGRLERAAVFPERLKAFESKTPKSVFINSMSDIAHWTRKQVLKLFYAMIENPQHRYIALTKDYEKWCKVRDEAVSSTTADFSILNDIFLWVEQ